MSISTGPVDREDGRWHVWDGVRWLSSDYAFRVGWAERLVPPWVVPDGSGASRVVVDGDDVGAVPAGGAEPPFDTTIFSVADLGVRSYDGAGVPLPDGDGYPARHGMVDDVHGLRHGFIWFPPAPVGYSCLDVQLLWRADYMGSDVNGRVAFGHHVLPLLPDAVDYYDSRVRRGDFYQRFRTGGVDWVDLPVMPKIVNDGAGGDFGIVVGHSSADFNYSGYGTMLMLRYTCSFVGGFSEAEFIFVPSVRVFDSSVGWVGGDPPPAGVVLRGGEGVR